MNHMWLQTRQEHRETVTYNISHPSNLLYYMMMSRM